jgi:thiopeptide-type bacteriocin biosynthesis protein
LETKRKFIIGEEWLYLKIYGGPKILEDILVNDIYSLLLDLYEKKYIDKFFFVRFNDDGYHLRLRFHLTELDHISYILSQLSRTLRHYVENRLVVKVTTDTYNREFERYGSNSVEYAETLFSVDSLQVLDLFKQTDDYTERWSRGVAFIDHLLDKFELTLLDKQQLLESYFQSYLSEIGDSKANREELKRKYREENKKIEGSLLFVPEFLDSPSFANQIRKQEESAVKGVLQLKKTSLLKVKFDSFLKSIVHMHCNRLFRVNQRKHELVLYYLLSKFHKSQHARQSYGENLKNDIPIQ